MLKTSIRSLLKVLLVLAALSPVSSFAATYYVDGAASTDSGNGSATSPKKYITSGILLMSSGDTLIIRDGVYTGSKNMIGDFSSPQAYLPSGSAGNFTTIKADHVGQAIIDGQFNTVPYSQGQGPTVENYLHIDGIHFRHGDASVFSIAGSHNWVSNCGFEDGQAYTDNSETPIAYIAGDSTYNLIEDCWIWGKGRYGFYTSDPHSSGSYNNIFRRLVVRLDASPTNWMSAGLRFYSAHSDAMQNCIVIDSLVGSNSGDGGICGECWSYAQGGGSSDGEWGHIFNGNIALNNPQRPAFTNEAGNSNSPESWSNSVWWDTQYGMLVYSGLATVNTWNFSNMLMGGNASSQTFGDALHYGGSRNEVVNLSNSIIANSSGAAYGPAGVYLSRKISNTDVYNDASTACNSADGCTSSGQTTNNPFTSVVKYLPRTESGTQGPNIMYQIGGTGTFYGDTGWNSTSTTQLWPYPNEPVWAAKMKAYNINTVSGNRGFAALSGSTATPLTDYIWGYLGNPKPNIYGAATTGDTTAPSVSFTSPSNGGSVTGVVQLTASASDNVGVTKVEFYVNGALQATDTSTPYVYNWDTSALSAGSYTLTAKAYDAANNAGQSSISVNVVKDTTAPSATISAPASGATVSGTATITASATDNIGVTKIEIYENGVLKTAGSVSPLTYSWNTTAEANGTATLTAKAYDAAGNAGTSSSVSVTINNGSTATADTTAPSVSITSPASGSTVSGTASVTASASDNVGVTKVEFYLDGALKSTSTAAPYSYSWGSTATPNGSHTLSAKAYDAAGNAGSSSGVTVNVSNGTSTGTTGTTGTTAPIAFVQSAYSCPQSATSTVTVTLPKTQTAGDLNIIVVGRNDSTTGVNSVTDTLGNTYTMADAMTGTGVRQSIYYAPNIKGGTNQVKISFNASASYPDIRVLEYSGVKAMDKVVSNTGSGTTCSSGSAATTAANELLFAANTVSTGTSAAGSGYTSRVITSPDSDIAQDRTVTATGTYSASAPLTSSGNWVMQMVTFK
ncbi:Ig-like domain-containing protein [Geomonas sp. Red32]|uniref:Ig-like domain-containing protein n=1 Tax=Geomonas sp. Red32 TaxID=2912856 RepID=UPI00202CCB0B|nr:Ig-like domain-containing protein [Geomonas sp. Red32]MCM0083348.1 Ig-like domain-containing protein [Geomonas sp. Red32]